MSAEPSMEEILSSIKRIIAEEGESPTRGRRTPRPAPPVYDDEPEVLELSDPMPESDAGPASTGRVEPARVEAARAEPAADFVAPAAAPAPIAAPPPAPIMEPTPRMADPEPILSPRSEQASRSSLDTLSRLLVKPEPGSDGTLEGMVREMLRPMLRDWLDTNLPAMVEGMVAAEIARISGQPR